MMARRPPRILFVHPADELYGSDRVVLEVAAVAATMPTLGQLQCWLPTDITYPKHLLCGKLEQLGVRVTHRKLPILRRAYLNPLGLLRIMFRSIAVFVALLRTRPDVVYLNTSAALSLAPFARLVGAKVIVHVHEIWKRTDAVSLGWLVRLAQHIVVVSEATMSALPEHARSRARLVYNGFALHRPAGGDDALSQHGAELVFLVASRWSPRKGVGELLAAWGEIQRSDVKLVILGGPPPSGPAVDVAKLVGQLPNAATVEIIGEVDDVTEWLVRADCVLVPSIEPDPLPTIAIEAGLFGRAVIAANCGGLPEIVEDRVTGWLLPAPDVNAWTAMLKSIRRDELSDAGSRGRLRCEGRFSVVEFSAQIKQLLGESQRPREAAARPA